MPFNSDSVDTSSGLLGHFEGTVLDSFWSTPQAESQGKATGDYAIKPRLYWHVSVDDVLQENFKSDVPETLTLAFTIGDGWQMLDEKNIIHDKDTDDKLVTFKGSSAYGGFVAICVGTADTYKGYQVLDGDGDLEIDLSEVLSYMQGLPDDVADPRNPEIWKGFKFEFRGMARVFRAKAGETPQEPRPNPVPVKVLGTPDGDAVSGGTDESSGTTLITGAGSDPVVDQLVGAGADPATAGQLAKLVRSARSHTSFVKNAVTLPGVKDNDTLMSLIEDQANGPWGSK